jgi:hypothetical protein
MCATDQFSIVVAGDLVLDRHFSTSERHSTNVRNRRGVREVAEQGGTHLTKCLIDAVSTAYATHSGTNRSAWPWI